MKPEITMNKPGLRRKRLIRFAVVLVIAVLAALYIGIPAVMAVVTVTPGQSFTPADPPDGFSGVILTTADGLHLGAWYADSQNGAAVIVVHGAGSGRSSVRSYAAMLHTGGYGVLALSLRGYDDSEGHINRLGWQGTLDIGAAVDFLTARPDVRVIGGLGTSMGGEVLLGAASRYPAVRAVVADGATFRAVNEYTSLPSNRPLYRNFTHHVFTGIVQLLSGDAPPEPTLVDSIAAADTTAFLIIAAGTVDDEIAYGNLFLEALPDPDRGSLWVIPDVGHTGGFGHDPAGYERRVMEFYSKTLPAPS